MNEGYLITPVFRNYKIKDIVEDNIAAVLAISDEQLGKDYLSSNDIKEMINNREKHFAKIVFNLNNEAIGFCLCSILTSDELEKYLLVPIEELSKALTYSKKIGLIKVIAVKENYQGRGIGYNLVGKCISEFIERNVSSMYCVGWKSSKGVNIGGILKNYDFKIIKEIPNYWREDSLEKNYYCHDCGQPPCQCTAVIFVRKSG